MNKKKIGIISPANNVLSIFPKRKERDLLEQFDWDYDAICESIDETIEGKIIMRNRVVGCEE